MLCLPLLHLVFLALATALGPQPAPNDAARPEAVVLCEPVAPPEIDLEALAALEARSSPELALLRGGDVNLSSGEIVIVVLGLIILALIIF